MSESAEARRSILVSRISGIILISLTGPDNKPVITSETVTRVRSSHADNLGATDRLGLEQSSKNSVAIMLFSNGWVAFVVSIAHRKGEDFVSKVNLQSHYI